MRTVILYAVIILSLRFLGKRQVGELEPSELVVAVLISELAAIPIQDNRIPILGGVIPIVTLIALELILSQLAALYPRVHKLLCGTPSIVIRNGAIVQSALKKNRLSIDELMEELRNNGITDISDVRYAILETGGQLSAILRAGRQPVTAEDLGLRIEDNGLYTIIINNGRVMSENLAMRGLDTLWMNEELKKHGASSAEDVFLLSVDEAMNVHFFLKESKKAGGRKK